MPRISARQRAVLLVNVRVQVMRDREEGWFGDIGGFGVYTLVKKPSGHETHDFAS